MTELIYLFSGAFLIAIPMTYVVLVMTNVKDKALKEKWEWEQRYTNLMHAYKSLEFGINVPILLPLLRNL